MAYPGNFLRLVVGGDLYAPGDVFTWSLSLYRPAEMYSPPDEVPEDVVDATTAFFTDSTAISSGARLRWIKLNQIGEDGRYTELNTVQYDYDTPYPIGANTARVAPQVSLAITLRTAASRGLASRGRFYIPLPARALETTGLLSPTAQGDYAEAATDYLDALNAALTPWRVSVMSEVGDGAVRPVTYVQVGRVLDTIRSRRNAFTENYVSGDPLAV